MTETYTRLQATLRELFQLDQADLDFGIYRILNQRRTQVEDFLGNKMPARVRQALQSNAAAGNDDLRKELEKLETTLRSAGVDPDTNAKVLELRKHLGADASLEALENEVFSLLTNFFKRYYQQGDFISLRRYKKDVYAIPYEGEEVKLHWANHDQYYIKTGEYFKQYRFALPGGKWVNFELREASTEQANNKAAAGKERRFRLCGEDFLHVDGDTLRIFFVYEALAEKTGQDELMKQAFERLAPALPAAFQAELLRPMPTDKQKERTLLQKRLKDYTARNTFDYFIHKDLGGFLRRELDFFIKNEVLLLDDLHLDDPRKYAAQLRTVKALKAAATPVIDFLAQLENFQKKLWLKKKFVVETNWCITLDRVPKELYPEIAANTAQREEWQRLFHIQDLPGYSEPLTVAFLEANPYLVLDTQFFTDGPPLPRRGAGDEGDSLRDRLVASIENLDEQCDGLLIHSENFQALQLLQARYKEQVKSVYIDPPYNTGKNDFTYKDGYRHSSWLTLIWDRQQLEVPLLAADGLSMTSIGDDEVERLASVIKEHRIVEDDDFIGVFTVKSPSEVSTTLKVKANEFLVAYCLDNKKAPIQGNWKVQEGRCTLGNEDQTQPELVFPAGIEVRGVEDGIYTTIRGTGGTEDITLISDSVIVEDGKLAQPVKLKARWRNPNDLKKYFAKLSSGSSDVILNKFGKEITHVYLKGDRFQPQMIKRGREIPRTIIDGFTSKGGDVLYDIFKDDSFKHPKHPDLIAYLLSLSMSETSVVIDYFAGSGTTAHAVLELNREDNADADGRGRRKYILVEMGEYFESVTKPRMQKVVYSRKWKAGKPEGREGISHCFKTIRLESYEDVLNNLQVHAAGGELFGSGAAGFEEDHLLHYALDVESRESLLNVRHFADPFNYRLRITRHNEVQEERIDLVETFNYLIGLVVHHRQWMSGFHVVTGALLSGEKVLIIWRNTTEKDNAALEAFFKKRQYNPRDTEFDLIYVNGDNTLENLRTGEEHWKVRLIEEEFLKRMWEGKDV